MPDPIDFFVHIPKTAGTTMVEILRRQYPRGSIAVFSDADAAEREQRLRALPPETRIVTGHIGLYWAQFFPRPCRAFTVLRDATARVVSLYHYIAQTPQHFWHEGFHRGEVGLETIARHHGAVQARYLAGVGMEEAIGDDELIAAAKTRLERDFTAFGLMERFDESLLLCGDALGWKVRSYARLNVRRGKANARLTPEQIAVIQQHNRPDTEVYAFARELFERRLAAQAPDFAERVAALRRGVWVANAAERVRASLTALKRRVLPA